MIPQKNRIPRKDFPSDHREGFRVFSPLFSGVIYPSTKGVRVSTVVSKKTAKAAVTRNSLKRRFYAAISPHLKSFSREVLVVLYPKKDAIKAPFSLIQSEVENVLRRAKFLS
jgi:ribonuclease P protein component